MKPCIHCGAELPDEANFCPTCGKTQALAVPEKAPRPWRRKLLTVLAVLSNWYQVQDPSTGMVGFISRKYVSIR